MRLAIFLAAAMASCGGSPPAAKPLPAIVPSTLTYAQLAAVIGSVRLVFGLCRPMGPLRTKLDMHIDGEGHLFVPKTFTDEHSGCVARGVRDVYVENPLHYEEDLTIVAEYVPPDRAAHTTLIRFSARTPRGPIATLIDDPCGGAVPFGEGEHQPSSTTPVGIRIGIETKEGIRITRLCVMIDGTALFPDALQPKMMAAFAKRENVEWKGPLTDDTEHEIRVYARVAAGTTFELRERRFFDVTNGTSLEVAVGTYGNTTKPIAQRLGLRIRSSSPTR